MISDLNKYMLNFGFFKTYCLPPTANLYSGLEIESGVRVTAHCSKANKEAKLVKRKICFILDAGNWEIWVGRREREKSFSKGQLHPYPHPQQISWQGLL